MANYSSLKSGELAKATTAQPALAVPTNSSEISSLGNAKDVFSNSKPFILFGFSHVDHTNEATFAGLMPSLHQSHVTLLGMEGFGPSSNQFLASLQNKIRGGMSENDTIQALKNYDASRGMRPHFDAEQYYQGEARIIAAAAKNGIKVVGIDPRVEPNSSYAPGSSSYFEMDAKAAQNAAQQLAREPSGSHMAIYYGNEHITAPHIISSKIEDKPGHTITLSKERPPTLKEVLPQHGGVTTVSLVAPNPNPPAGSYEPDYHIGNGLRSEVATSHATFKSGPPIQRSSLAHP